MPESRGVVPGEGQQEMAGCLNGMGRVRQGQQKEGWNVFIRFWALKAHSGILMRQNRWLAGRAPFQSTEPCSGTVTRVGCSPGGDNQRKGRDVFVGGVVMEVWNGICVPVQPAAVGGL